MWGFGARKRKRSTTYSQASPAGGAFRFDGVEILLGSSSAFRWRIKQHVVRVFGPEEKKR
jgi:hypothetical protein